MSRRHVALESIRSPALACGLRTVLLAILIALSPATALAQSNRFVVAEPKTVDFGDVSPGAKVSREVTLSNVSNFHVRVTATRPSCECTLARLDRRRIAPGESVTLTIEFDSKSRHGLVEPKVVVVFGGKVPPLQIQGRAHVNNGIRSETDPDQPGTLSLVSVRGRDFRVLSVNGESPLDTNGSLLDAEPALRHTLSIPPSTGQPDTGGFPGHERWTVVETDDPDSPMIIVERTRAPSRTPRPWTVSKRFQALGTLAPAQEYRFEALLIGIKGSSFDVLDRIDTHALHAECGLLGLESVPNGMRARFYVRPDPDARGIVAASLSITAIGHTETIDAYARVAP